MNININPSQEWTDAERLKVIGEHVEHVFKERRRFTSSELLGIMDVISQVVTRSSKFLETNRIQILSTLP